MSASSARPLGVSSPLRLEHLPPADEVGAGVDQHALGRQPVAAGAARFLLVVLGGSRRAGVHDEAHVRSIDAHAERHRGDDDVGALLEKGFLVAASHGVWKAGVVRHGAMAFFDKPRRERLDLAPRQAVHDAGVAVVAIENRAKLAVKIASAQHAIGQVRPIEGADQHRRFVQPQLVDDVGPDALGRRRRERVERHARESRRAAARAAGTPDGNRGPTG